MARLDDAQLEKLRTKTVDLLLDLRAEYLAMPQANALKHWDLLKTRLLRAVQCAMSVDEWETMMRRSLQLGCPSKNSSRSLLDLSGTARELGASRVWLELVEREWGLLLAMARLASEKRREAHDPETGEVRE